MSLKMNESSTFPLKETRESVNFIFIFCGKGKPTLESYSNSEVHLSAVQKILAKRFNERTDQLIAVKHTMIETEIHILDHKVIAERLTKLLKTKKSKSGANT